MTVKESVAAWLGWRRKNQTTMSLDSKLSTIAIETGMRHEEVLRVARLLRTNVADRKRFLKQVDMPTPVHRIAAAVEEHLNG